MDVWGATASGGRTDGASAAGSHGVLSVQSYRENPAWVVHVDYARPERRCAFIAGVPTLLPAVHLAHTTTGPDGAYPSTGCNGQCGRALPGDMHRPIPGVFPGSGTQHRSIASITRTGPPGYRAYEIPSARDADTERSGSCGGRYPCPPDSSVPRASAVHPDAAPMETSRRDGITPIARHGTTGGRNRLPLWIQDDPSLFTSRPATYRDGALGLPPKALEPET